MELEDEAMAQLTIYVDARTRDKIHAAARRANESVSTWVKDRLERAIAREWPAGYFELFGSLADTDLERPAQPSPGDDRAREPL
jgi:hypothetical protein